MPAVDDLILRMRAMGGKAAAAEVEGVGASVGGLGRTAKTVAGMAGLGAMAFGIRDITRAAIEFQSKQTQLRGSLQNTHQLTTRNMNTLTAAADNLAQSGGYSASENLEGLTRLIVAHDSVTQAVKDEALATDMARRNSHIPYATALRAVTIVEQGRTTALTRMGIVIKPVKTAQDALTASHTKATAAMKEQAKQQDQNATKLEAMRTLWARFGGAVKEYSGTAAGSMSNFRNTVDVLAQRAGSALLPIIIAVAKELTSLAGVVTNVVGWFKRHHAAAEALRDIIIAATAAFIAYKAVMVGMAIVTAIAGAFEALSSGIGLAVVAIGLMTGATTTFGAALAATGIGALIIGIGLAIYMLVTHFNQVKRAVGDAFGAVVSVIKTAFNWVKNAISDVVGWVEKHWRLILPILIGPVGLAIDFITKHFDAIKSVVSSVVNFVGSVFSGLVGLLAGPAKLIWNVITFPFREVVRIAGAIWAGIRGPLGSLAKLASSAMNQLWTILTWPFREAIRFAELVWKWVKKLGGPLSKIAHVVGSVGGSIGHALGSVGSFLGLQSGGTVTQSGGFTVGERGPERVYLPAGAAVVPHGLVAAGAGDMHVEIPLIVDGVVLGRAMARVGMQQMTRR